MSKANPAFKQVKSEFIFPKISEMRAQHEKNHPDQKLINFGIGDVAQPLPEFSAKAFEKAIAEMSEKPIGYGPETGYDFLKKAIVDYEYGRYGLSTGDVFITDGIVPAITNILDLFDDDTKLAIPSPAYPSYLESAVISSHAGKLKKDGTYSDIIYLPCVKETNFLPRPPEKKADVVFLCTPNNPTGLALTKDDLASWVAYAKKHESILLIDAAYESFISSKDVPKSIYEIEGAKEVAIEFRSFSKTAGFSGLRCGYTIIPKQMKFSSKEDETINSYWTHRQNVRFNGVCYPVQKAAEASLFSAGIAENKAIIDLYKTQGKFLLKSLTNLGLEVYGGQDSPYLWLKAPEGMDSWEYFEHLLHRYSILTIPGTGFGALGEGYVRISSFTTQEDAHLAISRLSKTN